MGGRDGGDDNYGDDDNDGDDNDNYGTRDAVGSMMRSDVIRGDRRDLRGGDDSYSTVVEMDAEGRGRNRQK